VHAGCRDNDRGRRSLAFRRQPRRQSPNFPRGRRGFVPSTGAPSVARPVQEGEGQEKIAQLFKIKRRVSRSRSNDGASSVLMLKKDAVNRAVFRSRNSALSRSKLLLIRAGTIRSSQLAIRLILLYLC
jgi:hypothetical protein